MNEQLFIIRDRETGLFLWNNSVVSSVWAEQHLAYRFSHAEASAMIVDLEKSVHCCHVVPANWRAADENPGFWAKVWGWIWQ
jgi:hypothetical protein